MLSDEDKYKIDEETREFENDSFEDNNRQKYLAWLKDRTI